ncbi:PQQ-binding-like beta-propeller repeat protein [Streptomyces sp. NRRL B-24484]|uniref:outer membrane protein assembly factor BamB family protein n=1 Tax=Streptomyces sp. NRRL B-24484 TaxID=1463833 RepID=UPI00069371E0|nr:PQQ-binding-like beta-propeller repeat protein [Streptomyces sp. NRRL B-24484]
MVEGLWERVLHQRGTHSAVVVAGGRVVVHERRTRLVCLDAVDGAVAWDLPVGTWPRAVVVTGDRVLVLPQDRPVLSCIGLTTCEVFWRAEVPAWTGNVAVAGGVVLAGGWRGYTPLTAIDLTDGRLRRRIATTVETERPAAWSGGLVLGSGTRAWLIDPQDGRELEAWQLSRPLAGADGRAVFTVLDADRCAVRCGEDAVVVLRRGRGRDEPLATHEGPLLGGAPLAVGGLLWLRETRSGGEYVAVDPLDGARRWRTAVGRPTAEGVVRAGGGVVVASEDGTLFRLRAGGEVSERHRLGGRIAALHDLGDGRLLTVARNGLRVWKL